MQKDDYGMLIKEDAAAMEASLVESDSDSEETFPLPPVDPYLKYRQDINLCWYRVNELRAIINSLTDQIDALLNQMRLLTKENKQAAISTIRYYAKLCNERQEAQQEHDILYAIWKEKY